MSTRAVVRARKQRKAATHVCRVLEKSLEGRGILPKVSSIQMYGDVELYTTMKPIKFWIWNQKALDEQKEERIFRLMETYVHFYKLSQENE